MVQQMTDTADDVRREESSFPGRIANWYSLYGNQCGKPSNPEKINLPYDPVILPISTCPKD